MWVLFRGVLKAMNLLGVNYDNISVDEALAQILGLAAGDRKANVFFLNADCLYKAQKDDQYRAILQSADLVLPDGIGIKLATKIFGGQLKADCNGTDLSPKIIQRTSKLDLKLYFLGGKVGVAEKAVIQARQMFPNVNIVGNASGYIPDLDSAIAQINSSEADILFVAMGVPLQEKWIVQNRSKLNVKLCLGVGAFLDYLSGTIPRAPSWMRQIHMEWFWRIFIDPKRMFKRYMIDGFCFVLFVRYKRLTLR